MNLISKLIAFFAFLFPIVLLSTLESDMGTIENNDIIVLNAIESVLIVENTKHNQYFDDMDYQVELGAQNAGRKFNIQYDLANQELSNLSQFRYFIIKNKKEGITKAHLHYDDCNKSEAIIKWKDGVANEISYKDRTYSISYNEASMVRDLKELSTKKNKEINKHTLSYTEDGKIRSVLTNIISNDAHAKSNEQLSTKTSYHYTENKIEIEHTSYSANSMRTQSAIDHVEYITFVLEDLAITKINYNAKDRSLIETIEETILNESGQIIRRVNSGPQQDNTSIVSFEYNERGQVIKSSTIIASKDNIISHKESLYNYNDQDTGDQDIPNCAQHVSMIHSIYDEEGNLADSFKETIL